MIINQGEFFTFHTTVGGHRNIVLDIPSHLVYGKYPPKIYSPKYRRITGDHQ